MLCNIAVIVRCLKRAKNQNPHPLGNALHVNSPLTPNISRCLKVESGLLTLLALTWPNLREEYLWELKKREQLHRRIEELEGQVEDIQQQVWELQGFQQLMAEAEKVLIMATDSSGGPEFQEWLNSV